MRFDEDQELQQDDPRCARCGGPSHVLEVESVLNLTGSHSGSSTYWASHWCVACMREAWPASVVDERTALVWKAVRAERRGNALYHWQSFSAELSDLSAAEGGLVKSELTRDGDWYRGIMGAPYRLRFPSALLGSANFLLSPLGALKEQHRQAGRLLPPDDASTIVAILVPWAHLALDENQVLTADAHAPYVPVHAFAVNELAQRSLPPQRAAELVDALPEAWAEVADWETQLRPALPADWRERRRAAEQLGAGLSLLRRLPVHEDLDNPIADVKAKRQRDELDEAEADGDTVAERSIRFSRFLGVLAEELLSDPARERRYHQARRIYDGAVRDEGQANPLRGADIPLMRPSFALGNPKWTALDLSDYEGVERWHWVQPWLELESLMDCLRDDEVEVWMRALAKAVEVAKLDP
ncbi:MAG: hypothetical protein ABEL51_00545 [Salinibacter sp.]